ncbi:ATP-dependent DNA ligase [Conexibacter stalactiti]|uniref:DNA ligase (ATP) n=1 Tax=Conexibacter stalactiti TaxID=1940611 RepID=A0ABU4HJW8_9ACTN|nr:ATP-dependent DNA ligase [Conexibacter stalactiti]MDW5593591.1 ATP-dependent DNA ligase [Conexibacter stalactiti]MEC5034232.1 ATP-dependent DNA ligase [Conexibacter stalactiti]
MALPLSPPLSPQLARSRSSLPSGDSWAYEPKFDGFRAIAFVEGDSVRIQSRGGRPLERYFPELNFPPGRYVVDGEIVIEDAEGRQDFDLLSQRIHPAASRIEKLSVETPARYIAFDLLADDERSLLSEPFSARRAALEALDAPGLDRTPLVRTPQEAEQWLRSAEGVVAKEWDAPYRPGERAGMAKIKRLRTADAVLVGWRPGKEPLTVGSLILGLYDDAGELRVVGHTSSLRAAERRSLVDRLRPFESGERGSADPSRWKNDKDLEWVGLRPELVVEVSFDHVAGGRIRHGAKLKRWREDKPPADCRIEQLDD